MAIQQTLTLRELSKRIERIWGGLPRGMSEICTTAAAYEDALCI